MPHGQLNVTDYGEVAFGSYGLQISGALSVDATATLTGATIVMAGGSLSGIAADAAATSTVHVAQVIELGFNAALGGNNAGNFVGSTAGVTLELDGAIARLGSQYDPLTLGAGHVVLDNAANGDFATVLEGGVLEIARSGASGSGGLSFMDSSGATLQVDQPGSFADPIAGFGISAQDLIDVQAVAFGTSTELTWQQAGVGSGTLALGDGTHAASFVLQGRYDPAQFHLSGNGHGGTAIAYHP